MRTIRVTGKGQLKVHPDMTRITIELEGTHMDYTDTLTESSRATEKMKKLLAPFGFDRSDLKTLSFDVDTQYESYKVKDEYKRGFAGYKYSHVIKVEFESDNLLLGKILYALAHSSLHPEFRISYPSRVALGTLTVQDSAGGFSIVCTGVTLQKVPDRVFDRTATNLVYTLLATTITEQ